MMGYSNEDKLWWQVYGESFIEVYPDIEKSLCRESIVRVAQELYSRIDEKWNKFEAELELVLENARRENVERLNRRTCKE